jgi:regulator of RNase E activity RraA
VRDVGRSRANGFPIWVRSVTPLSGKWYLDGVEVNGVVTIAGTQVAPGDIVVADDSGVCIVPAALAEGVLEISLALMARDEYIHGLNPQAYGRTEHDFEQREYERSAAARPKPPA